MPASIVIESGSGQATRRQALFGTRIVARVFDDTGAWLPGEPVQFDLPPTLVQPSGTFPGGAFDFIAVTDAEGRAQSEFIQADSLLGTWFGTLSVVAAPAVKADFYLRNEVTPLTPTTMEITANGTQSAAQNAAYLPVTVRLTDEFGSGVPSTTLHMVCPVGTGLFPNGFADTFALTDAGGYATFDAFTASSTLGTFDPQISYPGVSTAHAFFTTIDPAVPTSLQVYAGNNQATPPNFLFISPLTIRVANDVNGPLAGIAVTFDAPDSGASVVWALPATDPVVVVSNSSGLAITPTFSANATAGTYNVLATSGGLRVQFFQLTNGGAQPVPDSFPLLISEA